MKHIKTFEKINELRSDMISGTSGRRIDSLEDKKYELKKDVKGATIGSFSNVTLPKGTIIYNLPGGLFADHFSLKNKYSSRSSQGPQYFDKPDFKGIMIRQIPDVLAAIEKNSKVLESITEGTYNSKNHIGSTSDGQGSNAEIYKKGKGYYVVVSGEADYDFDAKNDKELLKKLKDNEFDSTDILESVNEAKRAGLSKEETLKVAQKFAKALSKVDGVKVTVSKGHEEDSFDLDYDGEEYDGGSYNINDDGSVVNMAVRHPKTKVSPTYGNIDDDVATIIKTIKKLPKMLGEGTVIDLRLVNENVNDEIEMALMNWLNTLADGDAVNMSDLYLDNGILLGTVAKEIKQGREQIQEYFEMFLKKSPIGSIDTFILQNFGDVCISDGTYTFEIDGEGGNRESVAARYTYVWKKENEKWMIATHHSSVNPK